MALLLKHNRTVNASCLLLITNVSFRRNDPLIDFDKSQLDMKKSYRKEIKDDIRVRVHLVKDFRVTLSSSPGSEPYRNEGYNIVQKSEEEIEMAAI